MNTSSLFGTPAAAVISECGTYRYSLTRSWDEALLQVCFIMLNPSTADAEQDDPTIRRCIAFARAWGYGSLEIVNLFGLRATDPKALYIHPDPIGRSNDVHIIGAVGRSQQVIAAWGNHGTLRERGRFVANAIGQCYCLKKTKSGEPNHPLYLSSRLVPEIYRR